MNEEERKANEFANAMERAERAFYALANNAAKAMEEIRELVVAMRAERFRMLGRMTRKKRKAAIARELRESGDR